MNSQISRASTICVAALALAALPRTALAGPTEAGGNAPKAGSVKSDPAAATSLFYEARALMRKGQYAAACPKLEESMRLDYGIGTEFNLADCNEHLGKTATAWSGFLDVAAAAKAAGQPKRESVARDRAKAIEARVPKLVVEVPKPTSGMEVRRDGVVVGSAEWGTAVPVDPGTHHVVVSAPGKAPWSASAHAVDGSTVRVKVPGELPDAIAVAAPVQTTVPAMTSLTSGAADAPPPTLDFPEPVVEDGSTQRTIGWIVGAAGLAGLGVGAGFGIDSLSKRNDADGHCIGDLCDATGVQLRDDAIRSGNVATIATIAGGAALLGGIVLVVTAPSGSERPAREARKVPRKYGTLEAVPQLASGGGGLTLHGVFQ